MKPPCAPVLLLLLVSPATAQDDIPKIPSEAEKKAALLLAFEANGNSMSSIGSIDLTMPKSIRTVPVPITKPEKVTK